MEIKNNENKELCAKCGGKCCKTYAGAYHPDDFNHELTDAWLQDLLEGNHAYPDGKPILVSIDWAEGVKDGPDGRGYFLRPRHAGGDIVDPSWGAECYHLTETGCDLSFDERPWRCKLKEPSECFTWFTSKPGTSEKGESMEAWRPYWDKLHKLCLKYDKGTHTGEMDPLAKIFGEILAGLNGGD